MRVLPDARSLMPFIAISLSLCAIPALLPAQSSGGSTTSQTTTSGPGQGAASPGQTLPCSNPPCTRMPTGKHHGAPPSPTPAQREQFEQEMRFGSLFAHLDMEEREAEAEEKAGHTEMANAWRADFARKSGLTADEAAKVKQIAAQYLLDHQAASENLRSTLIAVRQANPGVRMSATNSPEIAAAQQRMKDLFPKAVADLLAALGPESFSRLDGYTRHMHDQSRIVRPAQSAPSPQRPPGL